MGSSDDPARKLGALLTGSEAREIADHLADDDTLTASLRVGASRPPGGDPVAAIGHRPGRDDHRAAGDRRRTVGADDRGPAMDDAGPPGPARAADAVGDVPGGQREVLGRVLDVQLPAIIGPVEGAAASGTAARDHDEGLHGHGRGGRRTAATGVTDDGRGRGAPAPGPDPADEALRRPAGPQPLEVPVDRPPVPARHQRELLLERREREPGIRRPDRQPQPRRGHRTRATRSRGLHLRTRAHGRDSATEHE